MREKQGQPVLLHLTISFMHDVKIIKIPRPVPPNLNLSSKELDLRPNTSRKVMTTSGQDKQTSQPEATHNFQKAPFLLELAQFDLLTSRTK